jgi:acyl-CoA thioesterase
VASYVDDTRVEPIDATGRRFKAAISPDWAVWGPNGGYIAAIALRAVGASAQLRRPASLSCQYLSIAKFAEVELQVEILRGSRTTEAHRVLMTQAGAPILSMNVWVIADDMKGYEHSQVIPPDVPQPEALKEYSELAADFHEWPYPYFRSVDGKPCVWDDDAVPGSGPALYQGWWRCRETKRLDDPFLEAGRYVLWLDAMMWNALEPTLAKPYAYIAPNLDLSVQFHQFAPEAEWLLHDAQAPIARDGLVGTTGRVWSPDMRLLATGTSQLLCRNNPMLGRM